MPSATPVMIRHQWWLTSSETPAEPARSTPGMHSREIETPSGRMSRFQQNKHALLAVADGGVVGGEEPRALGDEQVVAGDRVVDVLADLADDLSGQVAVDRGEQRRRNDGAGLHLEGAPGHDDRLSEIGRGVDAVATEEVGLVLLQVRIAAAGAADWRRRGRSAFAVPSAGRRRRTSAPPRSPRPPGGPVLGGALEVDEDRR